MSPPPSPRDDPARRLDTIARKDTGGDEGGDEDICEYVYIYIFICTWERRRKLTLPSGGEEVLLDVGGQDATEAFEDVGHSDEAREILEGLLVGKLERKVRTMRCVHAVAFFLPLLSNPFSVSRREYEGDCASKYASAAQHASAQYTSPLSSPQPFYHSSKQETLLTHPPGRRPQAQILRPSQRLGRKLRRRLLGRRSLRHRPRRRRPRLRRVQVSAGAAGGAVAVMGRKGRRWGWGYGVGWWYCER